MDVLYVYKFEDRKLWNTVSVMLVVELLILLVHNFSAFS